MRIEIFSEYQIPLKNSEQEVEKLLNNNSISLFQKIILLSGALPTNAKTFAQSSDKRNNPTGLRKLIQDNTINEFLDNIFKEYLDSLNFTKAPDLQLFPKTSWIIQIIFTLRKPYISQDDTDFYIIDNPVKKEWVFKVPYVAPGQWKGALQATMVRQLVGEKHNLGKQEWIVRRLQLVRLFGNEKGVAVDDTKFESYLDRQKPECAQEYRKRMKEITKSGYIAGNLHFYPTYFNRIGLEVINPHERDTGVGKQPIYFECVPEGTEGQFTILYAPLHGEINEGTSKSDFEAVAKGIKAMLTIYGFGAKTSSGFGVADVDPKDAIVNPNNMEKLWLEVWGEKA